MKKTKIRKSKKRKWQDRCNQVAEKIAAREGFVLAKKSLSEVWMAIELVKAGYKQARLDMAKELVKKNQKK